MKYTIILAAAVALMAAYLLFGHNGLMKYAELVSIRKDYEERIRNMDEKLDAMRRELELARKDKEYLESVIRRDLGLQKEGEDLYIIEDNRSVKRNE